MADVIMTVTVTVVVAVAVVVMDMVPVHHASAGTHVSPSAGVADHAAARSRVVQEREMAAAMTVTVTEAVTGSVRVAAAGGRQQR